MNQTAHYSKGVALQTSLRLNHEGQTLEHTRWFLQRLKELSGEAIVPLAIPITVTFRIGMVPARESLH